MAIAISNIESAIKRVYSELIKSQKDLVWFQMSEEQLLFELISCILGSQVPYESALAAAQEIRQADLLKMPVQKYTLNEYENNILTILKTPLCYQNGSLAHQKYRFPKTKSDQISRTVWAIYSNIGSLKCIFNSMEEDKKIRRKLVKIAVGIGPKQASLFLRNVGYSKDLAILDKHVLCFMRIFGFIDNRVTSVPSISSYEKYEAKLVNYAVSLGLSLGYLDYAIWIVMRVYQKKV